MANDADKVGFGRPPKTTRFKAGQSGNPSGRPKSRKSFGSELLEELAEIVVVEHGSKKLEISNGRAIAKALVAAAVEGQMRAITLLVTWCAKALPDDAETQDQLTGPDSEIFEKFVQRELQRRASENDVAVAAEPSGNNDRNDSHE